MRSHLFGPPPERGLFCNRTLNLRAIKAVGYDMDYTLIHYRVEAWERRAYEYIRDRLVEQGWPVGDLMFDPGLAIRGLIIDTEKGNLLKANRFGIVKKALHGTRPMDFEAQRDEYASTLIDLHERRWVFLNTLFSLSEACIFAQLVDRLDAGQLPGSTPMGYTDLYEHVRKNLDATHMQGRLKAEIIADPERYVLDDPETPLALLDQRHAGKKLLLITNSEWAYTEPMMHFAFDKHLPAGMTWRQLFDVVIVSARKPEFFTTRSALYEVVASGGEALLRQHSGPLKPGTPYFGGSALELERHLGMSGDQILYVGDHMFGDVHVTKDVLRWRTALILRELEDEVRAIAGFRATEARLGERMVHKERLEAESCQLRLEQQRRRFQYGPRSDTLGDADLVARLGELRAELEALDAELGPMARAATELSNPVWGLLTRAGNDKSHLARQMERYADIYTSRVSNFLFATPFVYLRSPRGSLPHDPSLPGGTPVFPSSDGGGGGVMGPDGVE